MTHLRMPNELTERRGTAVLIVAAICVTALPGHAQTPEGAMVAESPAIEKPPTPADARDLLMRGEYERAREMYHQLAKEPGQESLAVRGEVDAMIRVGEYADARALLEKHKADDDAQWHYLYAWVSKLTGDYDESVTHLRHAIRLNPRDAAPRLLLAQMLETIGKYDEALIAYRWFEDRLLRSPDLPEDAAWITDIAIGFLRYSTLSQTNVVSRTRHVLHEMLQPAYERIDRTYWPARIAAAELLREKFNNDTEDGCVADYRAALRINEHLCEAFVGLGEVALEDWDFEEVEAQVKAALEVNPNFAPAIHLAAKNHIVERKYDAATEKCERALKINPNDVVALSIEAAAAACRFEPDEVERLRKRVAQINLKNAVFHEIVGDALSGIRQYAASEKQYLQAVAIEPTNANVHTELGMMYMQWGLEDKARDALDIAWELDPFNKRTKFTLDLLDSLQRFARHETEHFTIRYDDKQDPGLGPYLADYLEDIYSEVTGDFDTPLTVKTMIEVFPTQRAFAVRITGKPWIPTVGACAGRIIALASPRSDPALMGPYDIGQVLKHEFTHTVTLAATHNRIPHWFTEGLAVMTENRDRPFDWWELLAEATRRNELFTVQSINWGFMRPRKPTDRTLAYAQSEMMCQYIVERFSFDTLNKMLGWFREGMTNDVVFRSKLGIEPEEFDRDLQQWIRKHVETLGFDLTPPEDAGALKGEIEEKGETASRLGRLARALWDEGAGEEAMSTAEKALKLQENDKNALTVRAQVLGALLEERMDDEQRRDYEDQLLPILERLDKVDPETWTVPKLSARVALARKEWDKAEEFLRRLQRVCPHDSESWQGLAGIYLERGENDKALAQLLELSRTNVHDPDAPAQVAAIHTRRGHIRDATFWYRRSLFISPFDVTHLDALADAYMQLGDTAAALRQYAMLTRIEPANAAHFENAAVAAHKLGDTGAAQKFAKEAVKLNPDSGVRSLAGE